MREEATTTILLCGVGGQGAILAADLLARVALLSGKQAKVSEIHGMAQRGGAVTTVVRYGDEVRSMVCDEGGADYVVAFEATEALRNVPFLAPEGTLVVNDEVIVPLPVAIGAAQMPMDGHRELERLGACLVPAAQLAEEAGNAKAANVALLGALSAFLPFGHDAWEQAVRQRVPERLVDVNLAALAGGRAFADMAGEGEAR